jgi:phage portal protein BeeE
VVGDGLKYEAIGVSAHDSQLIEQLKWTAEVVCSTFHVPPYKIGVGQMPPYTNVQALNVEYYGQCLQSLIESAELCLDEGLGIGEGTKKDGKVYGTEFDVEGLLRMDSAAQMEVLDKGKNILTPDEARRRLSLPPTKGGDVVYRQQQDYSLAALAKRDAQEDPFGTTKPEPAPAVEPPANDDEAAQQAAKAQAELDSYRVVDATRRAINARR